jgi:hypothetical protein
VSRPREQIVGNLEALYREAYDRARLTGDQAEMARLDFGFRRDQLYLEAILDVRDRLGPAAPPPAPPPSPQQQKEEKSVLEQISDLRSLTRLPFGR